MSLARLPTRSLLLNQGTRSNRKEILRRHYGFVGRNEIVGVGVLNRPEVYVSRYKRSVIRGVGSRVEKTDT